MQMKKKIKEERGSMAVYVAIALVSFLLILVALYTTSASVRKAQLTTIVKIKEAYEKDNSKIDETYYEHVQKLPDTTPPTASITLSQDSVEAGASITITILQADNVQLDLTKCRYVYNNSAISLGTNESSYTGGQLSSESNTLTFSSSTAGTFYLHVLTVDTNGNAIETISKAITITKDTVAPTATITVASTAALTGNSISITVTQSDNQDKLDLSNCKYVYNTSSTKLGTTASSYTGGTLSSKSNTLTFSSSTAGTYYLHVLTVDLNGNATETVSSGMTIVSTAATTYASVNSSYYTFTAPANGTYKLQVWGAQGGYRSSSTYGGKGGYSVGTITLTKGKKLYVYVGGAGGNSSSSTGAVVTGGYNGGGYRYGYPGGGGATDIRLTSGTWNNSSSLLSRVIVAGGGGSDGAATKTGMYGGGTTGGSSTANYTANSSYCGKGGTQTYSGYSSSYTITTQATSGLNSNTTANYCGGFGFGGGGVYLSNGYGGAGGGGWYGGSGTVPDSSGDDDRGGGGGSGFVWTSSTASNVPSGYSVSSTYYLTDAATYAGNTSFESTSGGTETGHSGNGYAKITAITVTGSSSTTSSN